MTEVIGAAVVVALGMIAVLHACWAYSSWPLASRRDFAEVVVGRPSGVLPNGFAALSVAVAVLLAAAAYLVAARAGLLSSGLPAWMVAAGTTTVAAVLLVSGVGGLIQSGFGLGDSPERYRRLDLRLYSPLCLALAVLTALVAAGG
jgi:hypothetical protein